MKIFDKFTLSDKRNELVIRYTDCEMTGGYGTIVLNLKDVREGRVTFADVEDQLSDFTDFSYVKIRDAFALVRKPMKELGLKVNKE